MSDDQPRAPLYGPPITIPSPHSLGRVAYHVWCEGDETRETHWDDLTADERETWQRIAVEVARRIRQATERSHALGNYLPPPICRAKRRDLYTLYICCRWDPHPAETGGDEEGHRWVPVEP
jgi:hypothetical protein